VVDERGSPHVLAVAPTHAEIQAFTADVRAQMKSGGSSRRRFRRLFNRRCSIFAMSCLIIGHRPSCFGLAYRDLKENVIRYVAKCRFVNVIDQDLFEMSYASSEDDHRR
jgi:hypothetical protein